MSNYSVPRTLPGGWGKDADHTLRREGVFCFHFRAVLFSESDEVMDCQCLKIQPTWMQLLEKSG